jgi:hypothetical protein
LLSIAAHVSPERRAAVRTHFERELSFDALGSKLAATYRDLIARKGSTVLSANRAEHDAAPRTT